MLSYYITVFGTGALCLAAIYQTILYFNKRDSLLQWYGIYLWSVFLYLCYILVIGPGPDYHFIKYPFLTINLAEDQLFLMLTYAAYSLFWKRALLLGKKDGLFIWYYYRSLLPLIFGYIIWENVSINFHATATAHSYVYTVMRIYLAVFAFITLVSTLRRRRDPFFFYLCTGITSLIVFGIFSTCVELFFNGQLFNISDLAWIVIGYFIETIFFSAAIGYKLKQETIEKIKALRKVLEQQKIIRAKELEKAEAAYKAREDERSRIATELHDDLGSGLSAIRILAEANTIHTNGLYLEKISRQSKELLQNMGEIVWALNTNNDTLENLVTYFRQHAAKILSDANIMYNFHIPETIPSIKISGTNRRHILLLIKEALHNILKHAEAMQAEIFIKVSQELTIIIKDDGKGIPEKYISNSDGNGLHNMYKHAKAVCSNLNIIVNNGTTITFTAPVKFLSHESVI
jgi:signal transduction histidine kinase